MANLSQIKRQRLIDFLNKIREEHREDDTALIAINEIESELNDKKYGLVWEEHQEQVDVEMLTKVPVFSEQADKEITADETLPYNFLLEGDNLHSLKLLEKTHKGKIDVIYIDPPYNTGNGDFVYDDDYVDSIDGFRHSKWISFMEKRLRIAHQLLSTNGLLFVSIDDNEQANLKLLLDEIFSANNFIGSFVVNAAPNGRDYGAMAKQHEFCLLYAKQFDLMYFNKIKIKDKKFTYKDEIGGFNIHPLYNSNVAFTPANRPNLYYPFYVNPQKNKKDDFYQISLDKQDGFVEVFPPVSVKGDAQFVWRWGREKSLNNLNIEIVGHKVGEEFRIVQKMRHSEKIIRSLLTETEFSTRRGTAEVEEVLGKKSFSYPKPKELIKLFMEVACKDEAVVLDFFAGSGTTGQALLELNKEDNGKRRFILCTNNENGICEDITYQRIKTVITGKRKDGSDYSDGISANLKYYKTDFIDKTSEDEEYSVGEELLKHIAEMVQLEYAVRLDGKNYVLLLSDDEADTFIADDEKLSACSAVYISTAVLLTAEQQKKLSELGVAIFVIPDYYFENELLEVGER